jgi:hypothetical protein
VSLRLNTISKARQEKARQPRSQRKRKHDKMTRQDKARQEKRREEKRREDKTREVKSSQDKIEDYRTKPIPPPRPLAAPSFRGIRPNPGTRTVTVDSECA